MKWPNTLTVIRHGESAYNVLKGQKEQDPKYIEFKRAYNRRKKDPELARQLAQVLLDSKKYILGVGEHNTAMTTLGPKQAEVTGAELSKRIPLPDVILVSPYERTVHTLGGMAVGWPELANVKTIEDERLREQEHGLASLYNDWRLFHIMHPDQDTLRELQGPYWYRYPQGENVPDVRERNRSIMNTVVREYSGKEVMMVTHHLSILALRANLERLGEPGFIDLDNHQKPINCGATIYRGVPDLGEDGKLVLDVYNEKLY